MTQLMTMQDTGELVLKKINLLLGFPASLYDLNIDTHRQKFLINELLSFQKEAEDNLATVNLRQKAILILMNKKEQQQHKAVINALLNLFQKLVAIRKAAEKAKEDQTIQNAINQLKATVAQLDSTNAAALLPAIEKHADDCYLAVKAQLKPAPLDASPSSATTYTPPIVISSAPQYPATTPVAKVMANSKSEGHIDTALANTASQPRVKKLRKTTSAVYTFISSPKVITENLLQNHNSDNSPAPKVATPAVKSNSSLAAPLLANEHKQQASTSTPTSLRVSIPANLEPKINVLSTEEGQAKLANELYDILLRALYTQEALNFWSTQVTRGGKALDKNIHARVKRYDDYTPAGQTLAENTKRLVDIMGNKEINQQQKLTQLIETANTAAEKRFFCCFKPLGRTDQSQALYRTIGNISLESLTKESVDDIRSKLLQISPLIVEHGVDATEQSQRLTVSC